MPGCVDANFYSRLYSNIDRGDIKSVADLEKNISPAIEMNYGRLLPENKDATILDIGCGWGYFLHYLKGKGYSRIEGIDSDHHARRLDFIRSNITPSVSGTKSVTDYLKTRRGAYDLVVLQQVIYYFRREELLDIMKSIYDSIKPGGTLIVETFNASLLTGFFVQSWDYERILAFTEYSLAEILADSGFTLKELFGMKVPGPKRLRGAARELTRNVWIGILKMIYALERGTDPALVPHIFSKHLLAVARKDGV